MPDHNQLQVHQLLGRIVYFHVMFFEPSLSEYMGTFSKSLPNDRHACSRHATNTHTKPQQATIMETPWQVIIDIADSLPDRRSCDGDSTKCCPCCAITEAGRAIALCWREIEALAYGKSKDQEHQRFADQVGQTLSAVYRDTTSLICANNIKCDEIQSEMDPVELVNLPISSELLKVWHSLRCGNVLPIESWLNHCSTLKDVAAVVKRKDVYD